MNQDVKDMLAYFSPASGPNQVLARKVYATLQPLPDEEQQKVCAWIIDHIPKKSGLDVPAVRQAMRECCVSAPGADVQTQEWDCEACGTHFKWSQVSDKALRKQGIHDFCPLCGLPPIETVTADQYAKRLGVRPAWYKAMVKQHRDAMNADGWKPRYSPREDEEFEEAEKRRKIDRLKKDLQDDATETIARVAGARRVAV